MNRVAKAPAVAGRRSAGSRSPPAHEPRRVAIGDLAREFGLTTRTLRFYEARGLISPERKGPQRAFGAGHRNRLRLILRAKNLGLTLDEIAEQLALVDSLAAGPPYPATLAPRIERALDALTAKQTDLTHAVRDLRRLRSQLKATQPARPRTDS